MKTSIKIALFVVFFIGLAGILGGLYMYNLKQKDMAKTKPDFAISATILQKEFEDDETQASAKFINKIIEVTGIIASVKPTENNGISVILETGSDFSSVICTFTVVKDPDMLILGKEITVRGECSGFLMDVLLNNCVIK